MKTVNKSFRAFLAIILCVALMSTVCMATSNTYAEKGGTWVLDGIYWLVLVGGVWWGGMSVIKRNITAGVGILIGAAIIMVITKNPSILENLGTAMKNILGL